jgi:hypothetical protein
MLWRFTDAARSTMHFAFRRLPTATERDVVAALIGRHCLAARLLSQAGVTAHDLPTEASLIEKRELLARAVEVARRHDANFVGTEHILLALAGMPDSGFDRCGASAERLAELLKVTEAEWHRAHPPLARRLGKWFRAAVPWLRGRA